MAFTLSTSAACKLSAGVGYNTALDSTNIDHMSNEVEDYLITLVKYDIVTNFGSLTSAGKKLFGRLHTNMVAQRILSYDTSGYNGVAEAEFIADLLENQIRKDEAIIKDSDNRNYLGVDT